MEYLTIVSMLAVIEFIYFAMLVGRARGKYAIDAPAVSGNDIFERHFRVHQNTLEQLIIFLPGLWAFGIYVSALWGSVIGLIYIVGRLVYQHAYVTEPSSRGTGTMLSIIPCWLLVLGGLIGAGWKLLTSM